MAESRVHEPVNNMWPSSMGDSGAALVDHYGQATVANGLVVDDGMEDSKDIQLFDDVKEEELDDIKEEQMDDIEEEDPIDPHFVAQFGVGGSHLNGMEMVNNLITSTTPLDLATLLQAAAKEEMSELPSPSYSTPNGGRRGPKRASSEGSTGMPDNKRKASNREAANRYRERKKQEMEVMRIDEEALVVRNAELRQIEIQLMDEIRQMRERMTNTFGFAPPYEHEPSLFDITSCMLINQDRTPKRVPFPKGLSPAEQNRESVRRDREKKKARFEALKAEEAILSMGREMLGQQVMALEGEIRMMKERMREVGLIVPESSQLY